MTTLGFALVFIAQCKANMDSIRAINDGIHHRRVMNSILFSMYSKNEELQNFHIKFGSPSNVACLQKCVNEVSIDIIPGKVNAKEMQIKIFIFDLVIVESIISNKVFKTRKKECVFADGRRK